jgi:FdhE protein
MPLPRNNLAAWEQRIERAQELAESYPFAARVLGFYREIATFQKAVSEEVSAARGRSSQPLDFLPFRDCLDVTSVLPRISALLSLVQRVGTPVLMEAAEELKKEPREYWEDFLPAFWRNEGHTVEDAHEMHLFFARVLLQPYAEHVAAGRWEGFQEYARHACPVCTGKPVVGVLREEGHGAKRSLVCSFCLTEWNYRRIICPECGEEDFDKLPSYTASQFEHVRVEACDTCKRYLKTVDLTKNGLAIPVVDELATLSLDLWAQEKGYRKIEPNCVGM